MASNLIKTSGSLFMGNPITYSVKAAAEPYKSSEITFHRVKLKVTIFGKEYELSQPAKSGETVEFDVSSAFRAASNAFQYEPIDEGSVTYPQFVAQIEARDVWLRNGEVIDPAPSNKDIAVAECTAYMGGFSDFERWHPTQTMTFSRKPRTGEIVCVGDNIVSPLPNPYPSVQTLKAVEKFAGQNMRLQDNWHEVYVLPHVDRNSRQFQFVNSRGVVESIRAWQMESEKLNSGHEEHAVSRFETFSEFTRIISRKKASRTELQLCSGFVSYEWAHWWANDFCQSEQHWMLVDGLWLPCVVTINDSETIIDKTKSQMCYVAFSCKPNINGAMW